MMAMATTSTVNQRLPQIELGVNNANQSSLTVKKLVALAVSNITYLRLICPETAYAEKILDDMKVKILTESSSCRKSTIVIGWIRSCFEALDKKYLRQMIFGIYRGSDSADKLIESYCFSFTYNGEISSFDIQRNSVAVGSVNSKESVKMSAKALLRRLIILLQNLDPLPEDARVTMKLLYYDEVTPRDYEPPGFQPAQSTSFIYDNKVDNIRLGQVATDYHVLKLSAKSGRSHSCGRILSESDEDRKNEPGGKRKSLDTKSEIVLHKEITPLVATVNKKSPEESIVIASCILKNDGSKQAAFPAPSRPSAAVTTSQLSTSAGSSQQSNTAASSKQSTSSGPSQPSAVAGSSRQSALAGFSQKSAFAVSSQPEESAHAGSFQQSSLAGPSWKSEQAYPLHQSGNAVEGSRNTAALSKTITNGSTPLPWAAKWQEPAKPFKMTSAKPLKMASSAKPLKMASSDLRMAAILDQGDSNDSHESTEDGMVDGLGIKCTCGFNDEEGLMILCVNCNYWQHAACYKIVNEKDSPEDHICQPCAKKTRRSGTDSSLLHLSDSEVKATCLWRRSILICMENESLSIKGMSNSLGVNRGVAVEIVNKLAEKGFINRQTNRYYKVNHWLIETELLPPYFAAEPEVLTSFDLQTDEEAQRTTQALLAAIDREEVHYDGKVEMPKKSNENADISRSQVNRKKKRISSGDPKNEDFQWESSQSSESNVKRTKVSVTSESQVY